MRGDLLFWTADGSLVSRLVALATNGPFVHVSVDLGDTTDISAHSDDGVQRRTVPDDRGITKLSILDRLRADGLAGSEPFIRIADGIDFLWGEIGNKYGWNNILNNLLKLLHCPYRVTRLDRYDCSSLVTRYLTVVGVDLGDLGEAPDSVSPNDLARALGVLASIPAK